VRPPDAARETPAQAQKDGGPPRRPSNPVTNVGFGRGASDDLTVAARFASPLRWLGDSRWSRGHAPTRWYLRCQYSNLSLDHLLSAM